MADQQPLVYSFEATGDDNVRKALEGISGALENSEKAAKATESAFGGLTGGLANAFNKFESIKRGVSEIFGALSEFAEMGDRTSEVFGSMAGSIGEATKRLDGQVKSIDLAIARNRALQAGLELNDHDYANLVVKAKEYADATGGDVTAAVDQLTGALVSGSSRALKPFGIDLGNAKSGADKFKTALASMDRQVGDTTLHAESLADRFDQLKAAVSDAVSGFARGISESKGLQQAIEAMVPSIDLSAGAFRKFGVRIGEHIAEMAKNVVSFGKLFLDVFSLDPQRVLGAFDSYIKRSVQNSQVAAQNIAEAVEKIDKAAQVTATGESRRTSGGGGGGGGNSAIAQQAKDLQAIAERAQIEMDWRRKVAEDNERWAEAQREKYIQELTKQVEEGERIEADQFRKRQENLDKEYEARQYLVEAANRKQEEYNEKQKKFAAEIGQYGAAAAAPIAQALDAAAFSGKNLLKAIKEQASAKLRGLGIEYTVRAGAEVAEAFALPALAGTHLLAAAKFTGVAAASFGGAALLGGGGGSATAVTTGGGGSSTTTASGFGNNTTGAGGNAGGGSIIVNVQSLVPTAQTGKVIADSLAATRRQYGYA